jgi:DNA polymerase I
MDVLLIDGKNYAWRHGWTRRMLRTSNGFPTGVIYGVLSGMLRLNRMYPDTPMIFCWDGVDTKNSWRHKLAKTYKANRIKKAEGEKPQEVKDVYVQIPPLRILLAQMGYLQLEISQLEADDLIGILSATLAKKVDHVLIYSSDKDFIQLMSDRVLLIRDIDKKQKCRPLQEKEVKEDFGILPADWIKYRSLVGDPSDNIRKPVKGLGPKTALKMLAAGYDPSKKVPYLNLNPTLQANWENVRLNYDLTKIVRRPNDSRLPIKVQKKVQKIVDAVSKAPVRKLGRTKEGKSISSYRAMMRTLSQYELQTLLEARHSLWALP